MDNTLLNNELPHDAVERVREIRRRHHEETKHMTREEFREHNRKRYEKAKAWLDSIKPDPSSFPWLHKK